jgi:ABC-type bacteriocin/lantibiotic exporter with double-glycine peptidase domain
VYQDTFIVDNNLRENILFSKKNLIDDEYNKKIIKLLALDDLITETTAGERGSKISGGQKQRIGIARALVAKPELLILDEFTSSLDIKTEEEILSVVDEIKKNLNTTIIMISHRKNPFKICDEIYKLENKDLFLLDKLE